MDVRDAAAEYRIEPVSAADADDVPPGYQRTEVGVIPDDWSVVKLGHYAKFRTGPFGSALHKSDYVEHGIPVVNPMQIVDGELVPTTTMAITEAAAQALAKFRLRPGTVVIGRRGDMGRCALVRSCNTGWLCGTGSMVVEPHDALDGAYAQRVLSSPRTAATIEAASVGSTMLNLNQSTLAHLDIPLPSTAEQEAIAEALSDADALIESLQQLIAKQRAIKQGAMQALLTGRQRLPGFSGEWQTKQLADVCSMKSGAGITSERIDDHSQFPCYGGNGLRGYTSTYTHDGEYALVGRQGALCGNVTLVSGRFFASEHAIVVTPGAEANIRWLARVLERMELNRLSESSAQPGLSVAKLYELECWTPRLEEQAAIAAVLSDMDAAIDALEARLAKTRALKAGMMQQLLTGRIRLI